MKWTIAMTQEELKRKTIIDQAIEKRITQKEGAEKLRISERHFRRVLRDFRNQGDVGLVSGHRGKPSNNRMKEARRAKIVEFIRDPIYEGFGPTLLNEKLAQSKGIHISPESLRQIMIEEQKHIPKMKKRRSHIFLATVARDAENWFKSMAPTMPGWKSVDPKPVCSCLWMMPPVRFWPQNLWITKVFTLMANSVCPIFDRLGCRLPSTATNSAFFASIHTQVPIKRPSRNSPAL
ncbi:MAG: hypothetical protein CVU46_05940 [Chloroflexi bacterium HGW-Chloroflexi-8]|nr:MAG: hypothetical protein CVU46_05940 [Chloroflexi bacterium HGW-Chloroflexi-8]